MTALRIDGRWWATVAGALLLCVLLAATATNADIISESTITSPTSFSSSISTSGLTLQYQATAGGSNSQPNIFFWTELYTISSATTYCTPSLATPNCPVVCTPSAASPSCTSITHPAYAAATSQSTYGLWVVAGASTTSTGSGVATVSLVPTYPGTYSLYAYVLTPLSLTGTYYSNIYNKLPALYVNSSYSAISNLNQQWGTGPLVTVGSNSYADHVSIHIVGKLKSASSTTETYTIYGYADDYIRVYIDNVKIIDAWGGNTCCNESYATVSLNPSHYHDIIIEYAEVTGSAAFSLKWSSPSVPKSIVPSSALFTKSQLLTTLTAGTPPTVTVVANTLAASQSVLQEVATGNSFLTGATAAATATLQVQAKDAFGNNLSVADITSGVWVVQLKDISNNVVFTSTPSYTSAGLYTITYSASVTGTYTLAVGYGPSGSPISISGAPLTVKIVAGATSATYSTTSLSSTQSSTAGVAFSFTLTARDAHSNAKTVGGDASWVSLVGTSASNSIAGSCADLGTGSYNCIYSPTKADTYTITVYLNGAALSSTYTLTVTAAAPTPAFFSASTLTSPIVAGTATSVLFTPKDAYGNLVGPTLAQGAFLPASLLPAGSNIPASAPLMITGSVYNLTFTPTKATTYTLSLYTNASYTGTPSVLVTGQTYSFTVTAGVPALTTSTATQVVPAASVTSIPAGTVVTVLVQSLDQYNNVVPDNGYSWYLTESCTPLTSSVSTYNTTSPSVGQYVLTYTPTKVGTGCVRTVYLGSTINGNQITTANQLSNVAVTSGYVSGTTGKSSVTLTTPASGSMAAGTNATYTITSVDLYGNPISTGGGLFTATLVNQANTAITYPAYVTDSLTGSYTVVTGPTVTGTYQPTVKVTTPGGWAATYYSDNAFSTQITATSTTTPQGPLNFVSAWGNTPPYGLPSVLFSVVWTGLIMPPVSGIYTLYADTNGTAAVKVKVAGVTVINQSTMGGAVFQQGAVAMQGGVLQKVFVSLAQGSGPAAFVFSWSYGSVPKTVVPASAMYHVDTLAVPATTLTVVGSTITSAALSSYSIASVNFTADASAPITLTLFLMDQYYNAQNNAATSTDTVLVTCSGTSLVSTTVSAIVTAGGAASVNGVYSVPVPLSPLQKVKTCFPFQVYVNNNPITTANTTSPATSTQNAVTVRVTTAAASSPTSATVVTALPATTAVGQSVTFTLQMRDQYGNAYTNNQAAAEGSSWSMVFKSGGTAVSTGTASYVGGGKYSTTFSSTAAGTYTLTPTYAGIDATSNLGNPTTTVAIVAGQEAAYAASTVAISSTKVTITGLDQYNNPYSPPAAWTFVPFYCTVDDNAGHVTQAITPSNAAGTWTLPFTPAPATGHTYTVQCYTLKANGLTGSYFNNDQLSGTAAFSRVDSMIQFDWGNSNTALYQLITYTADTYVSIQWNGFVIAPQTGSFTFTTIADDGTTLTVNGQTMIATFGTVSSGTVTSTSSISLTAGWTYPIQLTYQQETAGASVQLQWSCSTCGTAFSNQVIPNAQLYSGSDLITGTYTSSGPTSPGNTIAV